MEDINIFSRVFDDQSEQHEDAESVATEQVQAPVNISADLASVLDLINGTDAYDSTVIATGKLSRAEFLKIPDGLSSTMFDAENLGKSDSARLYSNDNLVQIYALNKAAFGTDERAIKIALLRMLAVQAGWYTSSYEVEHVPRLDNAADIMREDLDSIQRYLEQARKLAIILPLAAEHTFRTMGHHYLTGLGSEYIAKYQKFFNACVLSELTAYLPPEDLYHKALHWVSLRNAYELATSDLPWLPNGVRIRARSAPSGTAVVATSVAILEAMAGTGLKADLKEASSVDIDLIESVHEKIMLNPDRYHTIPTAYRARQLSSDEKRDFEKSKAEAIKLAPVLQGFLDSLPNSSTLSQAKALAKHADSNPIMRRRAKTFFKAVASLKVVRIADLYVTETTVAGAAGGADDASY